jgi:hypothetical protein
MMLQMRTCHEIGGNFSSFLRDERRGGHERREEKERERRERLTCWLAWRREGIDEGEG